MGNQQRPDLDARAEGQARVRKAMGPAAEAGAKPNRGRRRKTGETPGATDPDD
jgi:hypothetical protein